MAPTMIAGAEGAREFLNQGLGCLRRPWGHWRYSAATCVWIRGGALSLCHTLKASAFLVVALGTQLWLCSFCFRSHEGMLVSGGG